MRKKDIFFACLFMACFLVSAVGMAGDYLCKVLENDWKDNHTQEIVQKTTESSIEHEQETGSESEITMETVKETQSETMLPYEEETQPNVLEEPTFTFQTVGYEYFDDALFIGDSRTVGLMEYGNLEHADFFADSGMSVFGLYSKKIPISDIGTVAFEELLQKKQYGKIYLMLGINELGYQFDTVKQRYEETTQNIRQAQPDAVLYVCANLHVTQEQSQKDVLYNNENLNRINEMIQGLADETHIFYLDINELFDDETGSLDQELTSDAFHVLGKHYADWVDWLCTKAIVLQ